MPRPGSSQFGSGLRSPGLRRLGSGIRPPTLSFAAPPTFSASWPNSSQNGCSLVACVAGAVGRPRPAQAAYPGAVRSADGGRASGSAAPLGPRDDPGPARVTSGVLRSASRTQPRPGHNLVVRRCERPAPRSIFAAHPAAALSRPKCDRRKASIHGIRRCCAASASIRSIGRCCSAPASIRGVVSADAVPPPRPFAVSADAVPPPRPSVVSADAVPPPRS